jgi:hypothetical protein
LAKGFRWVGKLGLRARAGMRFVPVRGNRSHLDAARLHGLRKRSAGVAAEMLEGPGHELVEGFLAEAGRAPSTKFSEFDGNALTNAVPRAQLRGLCNALSL